MRIGILTHYYNSRNYGGILQSYALTKLLSTMGHQAEQISCNYNENVDITDTSATTKIKNTLFKNRLIICIKSGLFGIMYKWRNPTTASEPKGSMKEFRDEIPHSRRVYTRYNIEECLNDYDAFVVGSDQVWNPHWFYRPFYLEFVPSTKRKIAYAASACISQISKDQASFYKKCLRDFTAVSVRERETARLLAPLSQVPVILTLDPTLLLEGDEWEDVVGAREIKEGYVFTYFLGNDIRQQKLAIEFAKYKNLTLVVVTGVNKDEDYGDVKFSGGSPRRFLSLIKYASYVFTDSFHASVFSIKFQKELLVFAREEFGNMKARIHELLELYELSERFCEGEERLSIQYIENLSPIGYDREFPIYEKRKRESIQFLEDSLSI